MKLPAKLKRKNRGMRFTDEEWNLLLKKSKHVGVAKYIISLVYEKNRI